MIRTDQLALVLILRGNAGNWIDFMFKINAQKRRGPYENWLDVDINHQGEAATKQVSAGTLCVQLQIAKSARFWFFSPIDMPVADKETTG